MKSRGFIKMKEIKKRKGSMGIGTLIVFIALVLVAAVAAVVIINAALNLKTEAEQMQKGTTPQILSVAAIMGDRDPGNSGTLSGSIQALYIQASAYPEMPLNLTFLRIEVIVTTNNSIHLTLNGNALAGFGMNPTDAQLLSAADTRFFSARLINQYPGTTWNPSSYGFSIAGNQTVKIVIDLRNTPEGINMPIGPNTKVILKYYLGGSTTSSTDTFVTKNSYDTYTRHIDLSHI